MKRVFFLFFFLSLRRRRRQTSPLPSSINSISNADEQRHALCRVRLGRLPPRPRRHPRLQRRRGLLYALLQDVAPDGVVQVPRLPRQRRDARRRGGGAGSGALEGPAGLVPAARDRVHEPRKQVAARGERAALGREHRRGALDVSCDGLVAVPAAVPRAADPVLQERVRPDKMLRRQRVVRGDERERRREQRGGGRARALGLVVLVGPGVPVFIVVGKVLVALSVDAGEPPLRGLDGEEVAVGLLIVFFFWKVSGKESGRREEKRREK